METISLPIVPECDVETHSIEQTRVLPASVSLETYISDGSELIVVELYAALDTDVLAADQACISTLLPYRAD